MPAVSTRLLSLHALAKLVDEVVFVADASGLSQQSWWPPAQARLGRLGTRCPASRMVLMSWAEGLS